MTKSHFFKFLFLALLSLSLVKTSSALDLKVRGTVSGLATDDKDARKVVLSNVKVSVSDESGKSFHIITSDLGSYQIELKREKIYFITVFREDYNAKTLRINTKGVPELVGGVHVELLDLDFLLLKKSAFPNDISQFEDVGMVSWNDRKQEFEFNANGDFRRGKNSRDESFRNFRKIKTYLGEEKGLDKKPTKEVAELEEQKSASQSEPKAVKKEEFTNVRLQEQLQQIAQVNFSDTSYLSRQRTLIDSAKRELEILRFQAKSKEDTLNVNRLEAQILAMEMALKNAERTIKYQMEQLALQKRLNTFYILCILLALVVLGVGIYFYRDKVKMNRLLAQKNQMILDGIHYANTIQSSFLKSEEELHQFLPGFVLMFRPRDIVSGDVYWVSQVASKKVVAAIDCTGHGVPGAFISMIANTLLNEIVNNQKIADPGKILSELHRGVMDVLQQDKGGKQSQDGMDMSLAVFDEGARKLQFAGARNHMIVIRGEEVETVKADINSVGGKSLRSKDGFRKEFTTKEVEVKEGMSCYLFSDGYVDQFGGPENKKFNIPNFHEILLKCSKLNAEEQMKLLNDRFDSWKGGEEQLDDVLVIGFRF